MVPTATTAIIAVTPIITVLSIPPLLPVLLPSMEKITLSVIKLPEAL
ncbi:MAG: hypothetical protein KAR35_09365 [Candidatus Heimdallarchaeota archaeon]|nr:hypothetical protein [Candidatus Heimdallarchaeota archaeon]MCK5049564.1 hypothetical protein [Candidatus Heimdallarchaeota archaeon]